jgi:addiction module HigA family antidote
MSAAFEPIHPGEVLAEQLEALGISAAAASRALGIPQSRLSQILGGKRAITADTALRLSRWLGTDDEFWMNLQIRYDIDVARDRNGALIASTVHPLASVRP